MELIVFILVLFRYLNFHG